MKVVKNVLMIGLVSLALSSPSTATGFNLVSNEGYEMIKDFEGLRLTSYQDAVGVWTIGYGHTLTATKGQTITRAQANSMLYADVQTCSEFVLTTASVELSGNKFDALVSFCYNLGQGALKRSTLWRKVNASKPTQEITHEFKRWIRASGKVLRGLVRRRAAEATLYAQVNS